MLPNCLINNIFYKKIEFNKYKKYIIMHSYNILLSDLFNKYNIDLNITLNEFLNRFNNQTIYCDKYKIKDIKVNLNYAINNPSYIEYYKNGNKQYEAWHHNGKRHRLYNPTCIGYYGNGNIKYKVWYQDNKLHKLDGPAFVEYYENANIEYESWYQDGERHRSDGPAIIRYSYI